MTLKQAAQILGLSKNGLRYHYNALPPELKQYDQAGRVLVTDDALAALRSRMASRQTAPEPHQTAQEGVPGPHEEIDETRTKTPQNAENGPYSAPERTNAAPIPNEEPHRTELTADGSVIDALASVIEVLREQLLEKDAEIARLHERLDHQEQLTAAALQKVQDADRRGFFQRLLGRTR